MNTSVHVLIAGGTGFIGQELGLFLTKKGAKVSVVGRSASKVPATDFSYPVIHRLDYASLNKNQDLLRSFAIVINLAGASVAETSWNRAGKKLLRDSRVAQTQQLKTVFESANAKPKVWIQASGIGFYGDRGAEELTESAVAGTGFLADLCQEWEASAPRWQDSRLCLLRIAPALALEGGMMATLDPIYAKGLGTSLGDHYFPWIHLQDLCRIVDLCINDNRVQGPLNVCAPDTIKYCEFHRALVKQKQVISLPSPPKFVLRTLMGEKSSFLLSSQRAIPAALTTYGFKFDFAEITSALKDVYQGQLRNGLFWLCTKQWLPLKIEEVWPFFCDEQNLERITPPLLEFHVKGKSTPTINKDTMINYRLKLRGIPMKWTSRIAVWNPPVEFVDTQIRGPYRFWYHHHLFESVGNGTLIIDRVQFQLPLGPFGALAAGSFVHGDIRKIFAFRRREVPRLLLKSEA